MNQEQFIACHQPKWQQLENWLDALNTPGTQHTLPTSTALENADFPYLYRSVCHHLALARARCYSHSLIERLSMLVLNAHQHLYSSPPNLWRKIVFFTAAGFPKLVRREWRLVGLSTLLFFGPLVSMLLTVQLSPEMVHTLLDPEQTREFEQMYSTELTQRPGRERDAQSDFLMFGFYIRNNTSIGFQIVAGGLLFGLGSVFFLIFNGLYIGAVAGHLLNVGHTTPFFSFVAGHSSLELTAIVLSGAAGLKLGVALINPGRLSRMRALRLHARVAIKIIYGTAAMFLIAAFVEAFWSSLTWIPPAFKFLVAAFLWLAVIAYFGTVGLRRET